MSGWFDDGRCARDASGRALTRSGAPTVEPIAIDRRPRERDHLLMVRMASELHGVDYHQFYLVLTDDPEFFPKYVLPEADSADPDKAIHRLAGVSGPSVLVETGIAMGVVGLTLDFLDAPPLAIDNSRPWEAVSEVSIEAVSDLAHVQLLGQWTAPPLDLFVLPAGAGWYRVRAHAVGRSLDYDIAVSDNPREHHLLQLWRTTGLEPERELRRDNRWEQQHS